MVLYWGGHPRISHVNSGGIMQNSLVWTVDPCSWESLRINCDHWDSAETIFWLPHSGLFWLVEIVQASCPACREVVKSHLPIASMQLGQLLFFFFPIQVGQLLRAHQSQAIKILCWYRRQPFRVLFGLCGQGHHFPLWTRDMVNCSFLRYCGARIPANSDT